MELKTLDSDKSTFSRTGIDKEQQELKCEECIHYVEEGEREINKVTGKRMACSKYGYPESSLRRECRSMVKEDGSD